MIDLWPRLEPLLADAERPARYLNHEYGCVYKPDADFHFCMVYPDTYELGQANQALRILVNVVNAQDGMAAERAFLPAPALCDTLRAALFHRELCSCCAVRRRGHHVAARAGRHQCAGNTRSGRYIAARFQAGRGRSVRGGGRALRIQPRALRPLLRRLQHRRGRRGPAGRPCAHQADEVPRRIAG